MATNNKHLAIKNIAKLTDDALRAALIKNGIEVAEDATRADMIKLAEDNNLWKYQGNVVPAEYKARYGATQRCGDEVSEALNSNTRNANGGVDLELVREIQVANNINPERWAHCNPGQQVMNTGNVLRGKIKRGEYVVIGVYEWNEEAMPVALRKARNEAAE